MSLYLDVIKELVLSNNNQEPKIITDKNNNNRMEFNILLSKTDKNNDKKYQFTIKVLCFNESISNNFLQNYSNNFNNFFTGRLRFNTLKTYQMNIENDKKVNVYKYHTAILENFDFVITQTEKKQQQDNSGWKTNDITTKQNIINEKQDNFIDNDIPF